MTSSTEPNAPSLQKAPPPPPQQQQQQTGAPGTLAPPPLSLQTPLQEQPQPGSPLGHAPQPQPGSPLGHAPQPFGAYPPLPASPGGYQQPQPASPYVPGPYQQVPQPFFGQPMYYPQQPYGQPPSSPQLQQQTLPQPGQLPQQPGQQQQQPGQPPQPGQYPPLSGQQLPGQQQQQQPGQPLQYPQQPGQPQPQPGQPLQPGQFPQQPGQQQQQLGQPPQPAQYPQQPGQYPQPGYPAQFGYPPFYPQYPPPPQGFPQQPLPMYGGPYGQPPPGMDSNHPITGPYNAPVPLKHRQYSPGYQPGQTAAGYDPATDATVIKKALNKDRKIDLDAILKILPNLSPLQIESLKQAQLYRNSPQELMATVTQAEDTVKAGINGLLLGPRDFDVFLLHRALAEKAKSSSPSKYTWMLSLALLGRLDGDVEAVKEAYRQRHGDTLLPVLKEALRKDPLLANLYMNALENRGNPGLSEVPEPLRPALQDQINREADELFTATVGNIEGDRFSWIFTSSTAERLRNISAAFGKRQNQSLISVVEKKLKKTDIFRDELLYILRGLDNRAKRDADLLENTMKGFGTKDTQLMYRIIAISWDKKHLTSVKAAYKHDYPSKGSLKSRISGDTSGEQERLLRALVLSDGTK